MWMYAQNKKKKKRLNIASFCSTILTHSHSINTKNCPCNIQRFCSAVKKWKILVFFLIFAQIIDCEYTSEPPRFVL